MTLGIDDTKIEESFDKIATQLLLGYILKVNDWEMEITEIEFYFFRYGDHEDKYTHKHSMDEGMWRYHKQGLDITLQWSKEQDGGILIRGVKDGDNYINARGLSIFLPKPDDFYPYLYFDINYGLDFTMNTN